MQPRSNQIVDYAEYPILYVDDEPENLRIFELTFKREFTIFTAQSGDQGLEILNTRPIARTTGESSALKSRSHGSQRCLRK